MNMELSLIGEGGDTRLNFTENHVRVTWTKITGRERKAINALVKMARTDLFTVATVDSDGKADMPAGRADLPGLFGKKSGEVLLQSTPKNIRRLATKLVEGEHDPGTLVMVAQEDGSWKKLQPGDYEKLKEGEESEVEAAAAKGEKKETKAEKVHASRVPSGG